MEFSILFFHLNIVTQNLISIVKSKKDNTEGQEKKESLLSNSKAKAETPVNLPIHFKVKVGYQNNATLHCDNMKCKF